MASISDNEFHRYGKDAQRWMLDQNWDIQDQVLYGKDGKIF